jgi:hypothetical protein
MAAQALSFAIIGEEAERLGDFRLRSRWFQLCPSRLRDIAYYQEC